MTVFDRPGLDGCINCGLPVEDEDQLLCLRCLAIPRGSIERLALRRLADQAVRTSYGGEIDRALAGQIANIHATHAEWLHWELLLRQIDPREAA